MGALDGIIINIWFVDESYGERISDFRGRVVYIAMIVEETRNI